MTKRNWRSRLNPVKPSRARIRPDGEGSAAAAPAAAGLGLAEAYEKLLAEKKDLYDRLLRKQAELDNFRKRTQKEKEDFRQYAAEDLIRSLLPTLDGFERALQHRDENVPETFYQGLELDLPRIARGPGPRRADAH